MTMLAMLLATGGCSSIERTFGGTFGAAKGYVEGFNGAVAADEPRAALAAREVLTGGGNATDAMVAAYFTLAVTLPSSASLGSGGACLLWDRNRKVVDALDFTHVSSGSRAAIPVPMSPRGMLALHAKYGLRPWNQVLGPAETLARIGHPVSRALARALAAAPAVRTDAGLAAIFADKSGNPVAEGSNLRQIALAATLSRIRRNPTRYLQGSFPRRLAADYRRAGVPMTVDDLKAGVPRFVKPVQITRGNQQAFFPPTPGGLVTAQLWAMIYRERGWDRSDNATRAEMLVAASRRAYADAGRWFHAPGPVTGDPQALVGDARIETLWKSYRAGRISPVNVAGGAPVGEPVDQGSTTIVTADAYGQSVACGFTMNGLMGAGRVAPETGIVIAAPPDPAGRGYPMLAMMGVRLESHDQLEYMGAGSGSGAVPVTLAAGAARVILQGGTAESILAAPRFYHPAQPNRVVIENAGLADVGARLRKLGHAVVGAPSLGRMNLLVCPAGFNGPGSQCDVRTDRRGFGLAQQN
jgi:gamma-glutamyltranspeptidase/glutathione hydrolase